MVEWTQIFNLVSAGAVVAEQVAIVLFLGVYFFSSWRFSPRTGHMLAFLVSVAAVAGSLVYSNIIGYEPCVLCWWQRLLLYPVAGMLAVALVKKDFIKPYVLAFAVPGALLAAYHYYGQMFNISALPCAAPVAGGISCASRYVYEFGYITIPMMSFTVFALIIALMLVSRKAE